MPLRRRVPGLGQITWRIVLTKKKEWPFVETVLTEIEKYLLAER